MNAFAAAVEALYRDPNLAAAASFQHASDPAIACRVILTRPDVRVGYGDNVVAASHLVEVRASEIPEPVEGDTFTIGEETFRVIAAAERKDGMRLVWSVAVHPQ